MNRIFGLTAGILILSGLNSGVGAQVPTYAKRVLADSTFGGEAVASPGQKWLVRRRATDRESEVWVAPMAGGPARMLVGGPGNRSGIQFTPRGDWLLFIGTVSRAGTDDQGGAFLMAAPFDLANGTLGGPPRQISLEPVQNQDAYRPAISPDGASVAYVSCCGSKIALRIVPISGGAARTLTEVTSVSRLAGPTALAWTGDGKSLLYQTPDKTDMVRYRVSATSGAPVEIGRGHQGFGRTIPGRNVFVRQVNQGGPGVAPALQFLDENGRQIGSELRLGWLRGEIGGQPSADGKALVVVANNSTAAIRFASTTPGPTKGPQTATSYDWPIGWTPDSRTAWAVSEEVGRPAYYASSPDGGGRRIPAVGVDGSRTRPMVGGMMVEETPDARNVHGGVTLHLFDPASGTRRRLAAGALRLDCCTPPGGYVPHANEFFFSRWRGDRLEIRGITTAGKERLVTDLPGAALGVEKAVHGNRVVYLEPVGYSVRLRLKSGSAAATTIATFPGNGRPDEFVWSHDGKRLLVSLDAKPAQLVLYRFDGTDRASKEATRFTPAFNYFYQMIWLPDDSGFTMIAQPRDTDWPHIYRVNLADPDHPLLLTADDPNQKWGHVLSPDGKMVAYPSTRDHGSAVWLLDVDQVLKEIRRP